MSKSSFTINHFISPVIINVDFAEKDEWKARAEAARFLIEQGAPCGLYDSSGTTCLSLMIEKMPQVAIEAVEQFHIMDRAFRKHYYYLSYLEPDPKFLPDQLPEEKRELRDFQQRKKQELKEQKETGQKMQKKPRTYAKTPLEVIIQYNQLELIMHPVFQRLTYVKWNLFGKWGSAKMLSLNLYYTLVWTLLGILMPKNKKYYDPFDSNWWRLMLEINGVGLTIYFIFMEISQVRNNESVHNRWTHWKTRHMEKDLQFCHPRWPEEKQYLSAELEQIRSYHRTYFRDPWNIFEWVAYVVVLTLVITRILSVASGNSTAERLHPRLYSLGLIVIWLRFMRSCRVFRTLGPFIAILGSVINDTMKFAFLFFEFFIPYTVAFWIIFGANSGSESGLDWNTFHDLVYSVWSMTLMGQYNWEVLVGIDRLMAQILCGTYFALAGVVCMNLYIALLSDTFARVYAQAHANAVMQQAKCIIMLEGKLSKYNKSKSAYYMQTNCSPQEVYYRDDPNIGEDLEQDRFNRVTRQIISRINALEDTISINIHSESAGLRRNAMALPEMGRRGTIAPIPGAGEDKILIKYIREQTLFNKEVRSELEDLKDLISDLKTLVQRERVHSKSMINGSLVSINQNTDNTDGDNQFKIPQIEINDSNKNLAAPLSPMTKVPSRPRTPQVWTKTADIPAAQKQAVLQWVLPTKSKDDKIPNWFQLTETLQQRKDQQDKQQKQQHDVKDGTKLQRQLSFGKDPSKQPKSNQDIAMPKGIRPKDDKQFSSMSINFPPIEKPVPRDLNLEIGNALRLYPAIPISAADSDSQDRDLNLEIGNALRSMPSLPASYDDTDLESITSSRSQGDFKRRKKRTKRSGSATISEPGASNSENLRLIRNEVGQIYEDEEQPKTTDDEL